MEFCEYPGPFTRSCAIELFLRVACAETPQLPPVFRRSDHLADGHLDDPAGYELAGVSPDRVRVPAGCGGFCRADSDLPAGPLCGRVGGPAESPQRFIGDASTGDGAIAGAGGTHAYAS